MELTTEQDTNPQTKEDYNVECNCCAKTFKKSEAELKEYSGVCALKVDGRSVPYKFSFCKECQEKYGAPIKVFYKAYEAFQATFNRHEGLVKLEGTAPRFED